MLKYGIKSISKFGYSDCNYHKFWIQESYLCNETNFVETSASLEVNCGLFVEEVYRIIYQPEVHLRVFKRQPLLCILRKITQPTPTDTIHLKCILILSYCIR
jgi:hypothetical protein